MRRQLLIGQEPIWGGLCRIRTQRRTKVLIVIGVGICCTIGSLLAELYFATNSFSYFRSLKQVFDLEILLSVNQIQEDSSNRNLYSLDAESDLRPGHNRSFPAIENSTCTTFTFQSVRYHKFERCCVDSQKTLFTNGEACFNTPKIFTASPRPSSAFPANLGGESKRARGL
jgi:hypothetical protein